MEWIALGGIVLGVVNALAWWIERRDRKAENKTAGERLDRAEERDKTRLDLELAERAAREHVEITGYQLSANLRPDGSKHYIFKLRNMGPAYAKHVLAWLDTEAVDPASPAWHPIAEQIHPMPPEPLGVDETMEVTLSASPDVEVPTSARLWVFWRSAGGEPAWEASNTVVRP